MPTSCPLRNEYWIRPQVGVYGYTAYSATKFGLRGLAEALQHEVIMDNIHVTLIFPPDTDTPGLAEGLEYCLMLVVCSTSVETCNLTHTIFIITRHACLGSAQSPMSSVFKLKSQVISGGNLGGCHFACSIFSRKDGRGS